LSCITGHRQYKFVIPHSSLVDSHIGSCVMDLMNDIEVFVYNMEV
jgi:hypothetical protein